MRITRIFSVLVFAVTALALLVPGPARADGIIIPEPPICDPIPCQPVPIAQLAIRYHHVTVTIENQVAVTHVDQVFYNPNDWQVEGMYIFPLPLDAAVSSFTLWIDGQPVEGQVLDAQQARQTYENIVRQMLDPALLEYAGQGAVQARIFPIPPQGERRIELEYTQVLAADNGLVRYIYPLSTEKFSVQPLESVSISVNVRSRVPVRAVYSPTHPVAVARAGELAFTAGYEDTHVTPDADFGLYYSLGEEEAFHLLTYRDPSDRSDPDGFFTLLLAPRPSAAAQTLPKDVLLVLDRSGSMEGAKFQQAQAALTYILDHLNPEDRFNVISFSTGVEAFARDLRPASEAAQAARWVNSQSAVGSTDINRALLEAAASTNNQRPTYLIFVTDGLPTVGVVDSAQILANFEDNAPANLRLFTFGVGYEVDTYLLDSLAQAHHGLSTYVLPGEPLDEILSAFYQKISTPVLTDLELDFGEVAVYDLYPHPLPDLFVGSQIVLVGRYRQGGTTPVTLTGVINGTPQTFTFENQSFDADSRGASPILQALPRLWATRKIGYLLNQVRLQGADPETIDQIVRLSIRFGIVTPYTSYLVTEDMPLGAAEQNRIANETYTDLASAPTAPASGAQAVERAAGEGALSEAEIAAAPPAESANRIRVVGARTFIDDGGVWTDTAFDPAVMPTIEVPFLSEDYFALAQARSDLAAAFALGARVIVVVDGQAYEVVPAGASTAPVTVPPTYTPGAATVPSTPQAATALAQTDPTLTPAAALPLTEAPVSGTKDVPQMPCFSGLLPLALIPLGWFAGARARRK